MTANVSDVGFEFYWPKNLRAGVFTVLRAWNSTERNRYGGVDTVAKIEVEDDFGSKETWKRTELEEAFVRGWTVPFTSAVPFPARKKLNTLTVQQFSTHLDPPDFSSFEVAGSKINVGITSWTITKRLVGPVTDDGRIVRKKSILEQVASFMASQKIA